MSPSAPPPTPQEIQRKLSVHAVSRTKPAGPVSGTESDSDSIVTADVLNAGAQTATINLNVGASSSQPPLFSIAERRSNSGGEDSEDEEDVVEGGWRTADIPTRPRNSVDESVIKAGYLWKKGERRKTWKKRWFVLRPAHLAYYKSSAEYQLLRLLDLSDVHSCTQVNLKRHDHTFGLISPTRTFYLQASNPQEVQSWVKAIEEARQTLFSTSTQNSVSTPIPIPQPKSGDRSISRGSVPSVSSPPAPQSPLAAQTFTSSDSEDAGNSPTQMTFPHSPSKSPSRSAVPQKDPTKVIVSGYLMKCGSKRRNWRKRWFVLSGEKLVYSGSHMDTKPHRQFPFNDILDALEYDLPSQHRLNQTPPLIASPPHGSAIQDSQDPQSKHTFKIVTTKRTLLLCAPTEDDEIKWLGAIRALIARRMDLGQVPGRTAKSPPVAAHAHTTDVTPNPPSVATATASKSKGRRLSGSGSVPMPNLLYPEQEIREAKTS